MFNKNCHHASNQIGYFRKHRPSTTKKKINENFLAIFHQTVVAKSWLWLCRTLSLALDTQSLQTQLSD